MTLYPSCGCRTEKGTADQIVASIGERPEGSRWLLLAPIARQKKGSFEAELAALAVQGYVRFRIDGHVLETSREGAATALDKNKLTTSTSSSTGWS